MCLHPYRVQFMHAERINVCVVTSRDNGLEISFVVSKF